MEPLNPPVGLEVVVICLGVLFSWGFKLMWFEITGSSTNTVVLVRDQGIVDHHVPAGLEVAVRDHGDRRPSGAGSRPHGSSTLTCGSRSQGSSTITCVPVQDHSDR